MIFTGEPGPVCRALQALHVISPMLQVFVKQRKRSKEPAVRLGIPGVQPLIFTGVPSQIKPQGTVAQCCAKCCCKMEKGYEPRQTLACL